MKRDTGFRTVVLIAILVLSAFSLYPTFRVFSESNDPHLPLEERAREIFKRENPKLASKSLNLGLDLAGGTHIIVEIDKSKLDEKAQNDVLERCLEIIRNRIILSLFVNSRKIPPTRNRLLSYQRHSPLIIR
jgi:SecD/SecF fusion protein